MNPLRFASLLLSACALGLPATAADLRGPFEIVTVSHRESAVGHGMNPFRTRLAYTFRLHHLGKPLAFSAAPALAESASNRVVRAWQCPRVSYSIPMSWYRLSFSAAECRPRCGTPGVPVLARLWFPKPPRLN